jgi:acyl carrier protein
MTEQDVYLGIKRALSQIAPEADLDSVDAQAPFREELALDSYDFLQLLLNLHQEFGVEIPESDYGKLGTLDGLRSYLFTKTTGRIAQT